MTVSWLAMALAATLHSRHCFRMCSVESGTWHWHSECIQCNPANNSPLRRTRLVLVCCAIRHVIHAST